VYQKVGEKIKIAFFSRNFFPVPVYRGKKLTFLTNRFFTFFKKVKKTGVPGKKIAFFFQNQKKEKKTQYKVKKFSYLVKIANVLRLCCRLRFRTLE
jgi:hypothetical protein